MVVTKVTEKGTIYQKDIFKEDQEHIENNLLKIYPSEDDRHYQYPEWIKSRDKKELRAVIDYLVDNKALGVYIMGSSLGKDKYNSIDVVVSVPYIARGVWIKDGIYNDRKLKREFKFEPKYSFIASELPRQRQHFLEDAQDKIILHPKNKKAVPIYISIVTEKTLEEEIA